MSIRWPKSEYADPLREWWREPGSEFLAPPSSPNDFSSGASRLLKRPVDECRENAGLSGGGAAGPDTDSANMMVGPRWSETFVLVSGMGLLVNLTAEDCRDMPGRLGATAGGVSAVNEWLIEGSLL